MPAVPALITAGGAIGSAIIGKKAGDSAAKAASQRSPEELALMKSQTGLADSQRRQGDAMFGTAMPAIRSSLGYYSTLLSGSRGARTSAVAPEAEDIAGIYGGANRAIQNRYVRGGEAATATAENEREKAGRISRLVSGVRPGAAAAVGSTGAGLVNAGNGLYNGASSAYGSLINNSTQNRLIGNQVGRDEGSKVGSQLGGIFADFARLYGGRKTTSGGRTGGGLSDNPGVITDEW